MKLTQEQIQFLDKVCRGAWFLTTNNGIYVNGSVYMVNMGLTEIPVKFYRVTGYFNCNTNNLTTLKNCPDFVDGLYFSFSENPLQEYFKNIEEYQLNIWGDVIWYQVLKEYPFLINIGKKYMKYKDLKGNLNDCPLTKLYLKD